MTALPAPIPVATAPLRRSLKRGRAGEALDQARAAEADLAALFRLAGGLRPNPQSLARTARRLARRPGVLRMARAGEGGLVLIARNRCRVLIHRPGAGEFSEDAVVYTRIGLSADRAGLRVTLLRAGFCRHALERLVERSALRADAPLLPALDAEAAVLLRRLAAGALIRDGGDTFVAAETPGVWAGRTGDSPPEPDWGLRPATADGAGAPLRVFSVRTFLSPDQMRPTLWLRWRGDPALSVA